MGKIYRNDSRNVTGTATIPKNGMISTTQSYESFVLIFLWEMRNCAGPYSELFISFEKW
jgi:hypothetical protein